MDSLGKYLSELREIAHLTPEQIWEDIKLSNIQLSHIENNRLTELGDHGFARTLVYNYARYLKADEKKTMYLFDLLWPPQTKNRFTPKTPIVEKKILISMNQIWIVLIAIFVIVLSLIVYFGYKHGYLERPTRQKVKISHDSLIIKKEVPTPPDTIRARQLLFTSSPQIETKNISKDNVNTQPKKQISYIDSTDYVNELLFLFEPSPFNQPY